MISMGKPECLTRIPPGFGLLEKRRLGMPVTLDISNFGLRNQLLTCFSQALDNARESGFEDEVNGRAPAVFFVGD